MRRTRWRVGRSDGRQTPRVDDRDALQRPLCVLMSGAPGSGKSTLARDLGDRLRVPVVSKDRLREGTLWALGKPDLDAAPAGPALWYEVMEAHLRLGVSVIGDMALFAGVSEVDVRSRLSPIANVFNVHCESTESSRRILARASEDPLQRTRMDWIAASLPAWNEKTAQPLDLGCPSLTVDTTADYTPAVDEIVAAIVQHQHGLSSS
jgi:predicted kinase